MPADSAYLYPGTDVLRNRPGLRDKAALQSFEYEHATARIRELRENPIPGRFDLAHLKAIHKHIFQDVYDWAGELRTVNMSKGGTQFALVPFIEGEAARLSAALKAENNLKGLDMPRFVERLAHYHAEWNALHPFREGNGRSTREFIGQLAREAGYEFDQTCIENDKDQWNAAARHSFYGNTGPLKQIFAQAVQPMHAAVVDRGRSSVTALRKTKTAVRGALSRSHKRSR